MHRSRRISGRLLLLALVLGLATPAGCGAPYLLHLAQGQASVLLTSRSIDGVIADPATGPAKRAKLTLVQRVKRFGEEVIGLKADASFTTFTPVDGPAALYIVTAAPKLALEPRTWTFPFVGTIPYKGFFDKALAEAEEARLAAAAFDTHLRPAAAYSTLGWFTDPVLEPLLRSRDVALANVILHEKTHTTIFVPNHVAFNEGLASFVGRQGAIEFFAATDGRGSPRHREAARRLEDERRFGRFLCGVTSELARLYASDLPRAE
ncbi:MAG: aminopeptidase, partial [Nitrospinota bacterium]